MKKIKVLLLHGLEGSPEGDKALYITRKYDALVPRLYTREILRVKKACHGDWLKAPPDAVSRALSPAYEQARDACKVFKPDVVVGSSMCGALLTKLASDCEWTGPAVYLASAHELLMPSIAPTAPQYGQSVYVHGAADDIVDGGDSLDASSDTGGHFIMIPDDHRLSTITHTGILDVAINIAIDGKTVLPNCTEPDQHIDLWNTSRMIC